MAELIFIPLVVALLALGFNQNSSCKDLMEKSNFICANNSNKNECFKPLNSYRLEDSKKITEECLDYFHPQNFETDERVRVLIIYKPESMTRSDAKNHAIRKCKEKGESGIRIDDHRIYSLCLIEE
jgi:hypothetical protein